MLWKLSLTGIKGRLRDYIVLFSGLVMTSAIFYMFESIASNEAFLESNSTVGSTVLIFHFGSVLLAIITFVYILYANSFLMAMRQKDIELIHRNLQCSQRCLQLPETVLLPEAGIDHQTASFMDRGFSLDDIDFDAAHTLLDRRVCETDAENPRKDFSIKIICI